MIGSDQVGSSGDCTCSHALDCAHDCHGRQCDPGEHVCSLEFLPDEGGLTAWGCPDCTPGERSAHLTGCLAAEPQPVSVAVAAMAGRVGLTSTAWV